MLFISIHSLNTSLAKIDSTYFVNQYEKAILLKDWEKAHLLSKKYLKIDSEIGALLEIHSNFDLSPEVNAWLNYRIVEVYYKYLQKPQLAKQFSQKLITKMHSVSPSDVPKLYLLLSDVYEELASYDSSLWFLEKVIYNDIDKQGEIKSHELFNRKGNLKNRQNQYDSAIYFYNKALIFAQNENDSLSIINSYHGMAYSFRKIGELDSATYYEYKSLRLSEMTNYLKGKLLALQSLAILSYTQKEFEKSNSQAHELITLGGSTNEKSILANTYNLLGVNFGLLGQFDSALHYHNKSLLIKQEMNNPSLISSSLNNIAVIFLRKNLSDSAIFYLLKAKPLIEQTKDSVNIATLYSNIGKVYFQSNQYDHATEYYDLSLDLATKMKAHKEMIVALGGLLLTDSARGDFKSAFINQSKLLTVKEEFLNIQKQNEVARLKIEYETEKKDAQLKANEEQLILEKQSKLIRTKLLYGAVFLVVILILISIIFWKFYRTNKKLRLKNEFLLKEQNHRIKNNLQMITSLLSLHMRSIESVEGKAALYDGQTRINSVTVLHRLLYEGNEYTEINLQEYIKLLCAEIQSSAPRKCEFNLQIPSEIVLPVEKAISIGILINELLTNSIKHVDSTIDLQVDILITDTPNFQLTYCDNGQGITDSSWEISPSFGRRLIMMQAEQLHGKYSISLVDGFSFRLTF